MSGNITKHQLSAVYRERDTVVALSALLAQHYGMRVWVGEDATAQDGWKNVVYIELPTGQVSWHFPDHESYLFNHLEKPTDTKWDGHNTDVKYQRITDWVTLQKGKKK